MTNDSIDNIRLELNADTVKAAIYIRSGDTISRTVHCTVSRGGKVVDLSNVLIAEILIKKADGYECDNGAVIEGNEIHYTWRTNDISAVGENICQFMLTFSDGAVVTTPKFSLYVYKKVLDQKVEASMNEYTAITQQLVDVYKYKESAASSATQAENAAENAEIYSNNSATSATSASESAEEASASATSAASSQLLASQSEESARTYSIAAEDASEVATNASESASASATNAATSLASVEATKTYIDGVKDTIAAQATATETYATSAATSATNAATSESNAETYELGAKDYYDRMKEMSALELGTTHASAYYGDLGQSAYEHSQETGNPHGTTYTDVGADASGAAAQALVDAKSYTDSEITDKADAKGAAAQALADAKDYADGLKTVATSDTVGLVKPDGETIEVDENGTLTVVGGCGGGVLPMTEDEYAENKDEYDESDMMYAFDEDDGDYTPIETSDIKLTTPLTNVNASYLDSALTQMNNNLTHLASKLIYGGNAKKIEVMSDATNLFQLRIWVSDTKAYVLVCNSNNINLKLYDNSTWSNIWSK